LLGLRPPLGALGTPNQPDRPLGDPRTSRLPYKAQSRTRTSPMTLHAWCQVIHPVSPANSQSTLGVRWQHLGELTVANTRTGWRPANRRATVMGPRGTPPDPVVNLLHLSLAVVIDQSPNTAPRQSRPRVFASAITLREGPRIKGFGGPLFGPPTSVSSKATLQSRLMPPTVQGSFCPTCFPDSGFPGHGFNSGDAPSLLRTSCGRSPTSG
jgi:hypothetical protein